MTTFQLTLTGIFIFFILAGVIVFARFQTSSNAAALPQLTMWGTLPQASVDSAIGAINQTRGNSALLLQYSERNPATIEQEFVEALAVGRGPDLLLLPQDRILRLKDKLFPVPYTTLTERTFKDAFIEEGELYLLPQGVIGLPLSLDPLVMYWNRDLFSAASLTQPPRYWDELLTMVPKLTVRDAGGNITTSAVALGETVNVAHSKDILSMLIMQAGNPIVSRDGLGNLNVILDQQLGYTAPPTQSAVGFYTQFSDPAKSLYSWNRSLPDSLQSFVAGDLAMYIGYASEYPAIRGKNPNLNFDVVAMPQPRNVATPVTFGQMQAVALVKNSPNIQAGYTVASILTGSANTAIFSQILGTPPPRRDLLSQVPTGAATAIFYTSAIRAHAWLDPAAGATLDSFDSMVSSVTSGALRLDQAVQRASSELTNLINPYVGN